MAKITYADGISIFQLVYYSPCLIASLFVAFRHGLTKSSGWIFLSIFCLIRIIGASASIATITNPQAKTAYTIALVTSVLGLSPLLMASLGLLSRAYYSILKQPWSTIFGFVVVKIVHTPAIIALILCIVGATSAPTIEQIESQTTLHIGVILYAVVLAMLALLALIAYIMKRSHERGEGLIVYAVLLALPFLTIRIIYTLLAAFSHSKTFNPFSGSETASLCMAVLEEMAVVLIYLFTGLKLPATPKGAADRPGGELAYRAGRGDFGTGKLGLLSLGAAAFQAFNRSRDNVVDDGQRRDDRHMRESGRRRQF